MRKLPDLGVNRGEERECWVALRNRFMDLTGQVDVCVAATGIVQEALKGSVLDALIVSVRLSVLTFTSLLSRWRVGEYLWVLGIVNSPALKKA